MRPSSQVLGSGLQAGRAKKERYCSPSIKGGLTGKIGCLGGFCFFFFQAFETSIPYNQYTKFIYDPQFIERGKKHGFAIFTSSIVTEQRYYIYISFLFHAVAG